MDGRPSSIFEGLPLIDMLVGFVKGLGGIFVVVLGGLFL